MFVETDCTIEHEGQAFEAGGSVVTDQYAVGYVKGLEETRTWLGTILPNTYQITDWHGDRLGNITRIKSWPIHSYLSNRMYQITACIDGAYYTGRSLGNGMIWKGKRVAKQD
jgi:hypothetical protein